VDPERAPGGVPVPAEPHHGVGGIWLRRAFVIPIRLYQVTLSRVIPPMCRFTPSCSQYAVESILRHGVIRGIALGCWRILRCNPFCPGGYDPVPEHCGRRTRERLDG
jgi:uncharacterized protein